MLRRAFATVLLLALSGAAQAQSCKPVESAFDDFGIVQVGPQSLEFMDSHAARTHNCNFGIMAYCTFVDKTGVQYYWLEGTIQSKPVDFSVLRKGYALPLGVAAGDAPQTVKAKLAAHGVTLVSTADPLKTWLAKLAARGIKPPPRFIPDDHKARYTWLTSGLCLRGPGGIIFSATFEFDPHERLVAFETNAKTWLD
ncbi:MAG TPA: hypothetical protein VHZ78_02770 [Rhizomicrobium sp.]|nr:hypothetical protein [Rhizomicrobium sp.]